jgi:hypothetical protein
MSFLPERTVNDSTSGRHGMEVLLGLLYAIERQQRELAAAAMARQRLLRADANLRELWTRFTEAGGITAADLEQFMAGRFRYRRTHQRRHLRLFINNGI